MTESEYDLVMRLWDQKRRGSFNDVLRDIANGRALGGELGG